MDNNHRENVSAEIAEPKFEYIAPEYLSHDAPGFEKLLSRGGILSIEDHEEPYWLVEGEIEKEHGERIARALNSHAKMLAALKHAAEKLSDLEYFWMGDKADLWGPIPAVIAQAEGR